MNANPDPTSSGASSMKSRQNFISSAARSAGCITIPPRTIGPTGCSRNVKLVTIPKLPLPPRRPQNRSGLSSADAVTTRPSAVTTSASIRLSQVNPSLRSSQPLPDPRTSPPTPVVETRPPVTARPCCWQIASSAPQVAPPPTFTIRFTGSTTAWSIGRRSMQIPPSTTADPVTPCPPP
jgi:hypothetical protein